jgi:putative oxidoreductase
MQQSDSTIERWVLDVGRWAFAPVVKMDLPSRRILWRIVALIVGGIFIYAGVIKAIDPLRFAIDIDNYKMLPWAIGVRLAFYLPWLELVCGFALILRFFYRGGLFILTALTFIFIAASIIAKVRGLDITCGCFGHASKNWNFTTHLGLDFAILIALIALWVSSRAQQREL